MSVENKRNKDLKSIVKTDGTIKKFEEIAISTKTVIGISNLKINLENFYNYIPITDYTPPQKKRGRKRRIQIASTSNNIPFGSIISIQRKKEVRGAVLKTKKKSNDSIDDNDTPRRTPASEKDYFLHSVSLVVVLEDNKQINIKVSSNGKLQITGCKCDDHFIQAVISIYKTMIEVEKWTGEKLFTLNGPLEVVFNTVMQNMDFNVGFRINRYKLDKYINQYTNYCSIFEGSLSTGVNIKVKSDPDVHPKILKIRYNGELEKFYTSFEEYKTLLDKKKETKKDKHHTFLVFASGSIIMSSRGSEMKEVYDSLIDILTNNREHFEDISYNYEKEKEEDEKYSCNTRCCLKDDCEEDDCEEDDCEEDD